MKCPVCEHEETKITRCVERKDLVRRYRQCLKCGARFTTSEIFNAMVGEGRAKKKSEEPASTDGEPAKQKSKKESLKKESNRDKLSKSAKKILSGADKLNDKKADDEEFIENMDSTVSIEDDDYVIPDDISQFARDLVALDS